MVEEDQTTPRCTTSSGNNSNICRSSKKERPRKLPQRGLGVAQLEKMRLEEQQKKDSAYLIAAADVSISSSSVFRPPFSAVCNGNTGGVPLTGVNGHKSWGLMPRETEPLCPLPSLMQRGQQSSFSMVNLSSRTSSTSVMNFQMELPSNQSYYKNFKPLLPEEDKVIGMKRPSPFSLDNVPGPLFPKKKLSSHCSLHQWTS
ncbi:protein SPEAR2-like [Hibiscus syriacus]|uniref:protein SPEAR2-like n=1 Tax=Hibiscus syriacus TaxID=106335 RepID=UPI0019239032|nr:protein SPEAR2-like [Hibiscus syriacus]